MEHVERKIRLSHISPNIRAVYDAETIDELSRSIRSQGQREPITVWLAGESFRILDGEKRWRACCKLQISHIRAVIVEEK